MKRKKTLADFWAVIFLVGSALFFYFAYDEPQEDIAWWYRSIAYSAMVAFLAAIGWSKWKLGKWFTNESGGH
jgi:hypothetical protein